jgi:hypothetical protein
MKTTILILMFVALGGNLFAQVKRDDFFDGPFKEGAAKREPVDYQVGMLVEFIEIDARVANRLVRKYAASLSAAPLREELEQMIEGGDAVLVESCYAKTRTGHRTKVMSISEQIYATEYDPPEIPQIATLTKAHSPATAANPTAFEARYVGPSLEVYPQIGQDYRWITINVAPELVRYLGRNYTLEDREGLEENDPRKLHETIFMPMFYTMRSQTQVTVRDGDTVLVSLNRPHGDGDKMTMILLRADIVK